MIRIEAIIERASDGSYSVYCVNESFSGMGATPEAAKSDMFKQMQCFKQAAIAGGFAYPVFLDGEFDVLYKFDVESLLTYYSGILSLSGLEKVTGIHQKQLWAYLHQKSKPRRPQVEKIEKGLHALGRDLMRISL